jgi:hypothetical protein
VAQGDFAKAHHKVSQAKDTLADTRNLLNSFLILKRVGVLAVQIDKGEQLLSLLEDGMEGVDQAVSGTQALFQTTKIISGEEVKDPMPLFRQAQTSLTSSNEKISRVKANLTDPELAKGLPSFVTDKIS